MTAGALAQSIADRIRPTPWLAELLRRESVKRCGFLAADVRWSTQDEALVILVRDGPRSEWQEQLMLVKSNGMPRQIERADIDSVLERYDSTNVGDPWKRVKERRAYELEQARITNQEEIRDLIATTQRWTQNRTFDFGGAFGR
jgi:hypothetical protein